jgi:hypothetical protein
VAPQPEAAAEPAKISPPARRPGRPPKRAAIQPPLDPEPTSET